MIVKPNFDYGHAVRLIANIRQDSSLNEEKRGHLMMRRGSVGFIRQAGIYKQDQVIYQVHFLEHNKIIGCRESELIDAKTAWVDNEFEYGDRATLTLALSQNQNIIAKPGDIVAVIGVDRSDQQNITYRIQIAEHDIDVPARALQAITPLQPIEATL